MKKLLGVTLDYKLNFDPHIWNLCKKAATQINVLKRLKTFTGLKEKQILVQSIVHSNFSYCPLAWYFSAQCLLLAKEYFALKYLKQ